MSCSDEDDDEEEILEWTCCYPDSDEHWIETTFLAWVFVVYGGYPSDKSSDAGCGLMRDKNHVVFWFHQDEGTYVLVTITLDELILLHLSAMTEPFWVNSICSQNSMDGENLYYQDDENPAWYEIDHLPHVNELIGRLSYDPENKVIVVNFNHITPYKCYLPNRNIIFNLSDILSASALGPFAVSRHACRLLHTYLPDVLVNIFSKYVL